MAKSPLTGAHKSFERHGLPLIVAAFCFIVMWSDLVHSPSIDETAHLPAGISHWQLGHFDLYAVNPPLVRMVATMPVLVLPKVTDWSGYSNIAAERSEFPIGRQFVANNRGWSMCLYSIARIWLIPVYILGVVLCRTWATETTSATCGAIAALLYCCSTTVIANGGMLTPDLSSAVAGGWALWFVRSWLRSRDWLLASCIGFLLGIALLTKFTILSFILLLPFFSLGIWTFTNAIDKPAVASMKTIVTQLAVMGGIILFVVNCGYGFDGTGKQLGEFRFHSKALRGDARSAQNIFMTSFLGDLPVPLPRSFVLGVDTQKRDFDEGYRSYLMGEWKHGGWWYYYLIGFLVKEPIGFQLMLYASILHGLWYWKRWTRERIREWSLILTPPLLIFGLVSSQTGFNHHMRYVLPAYPFLFIIAARTVTLGKFWKWFSYACLTWQAAAVLWFAPHWMSYFNEAAGGPLNGHKWLVDSNIDWGQDILMLKWWQDKHPEATDLQAALFTGFDPKDIGLKFRLPAPFIKGEPPTLSRDGLRGPQPGWYAISVCQLKGHSFSVPEGDGEWTWSDGHFTYFLDNFEPVDRIGYSIYIYHITEADAARVRAKLLAEEAEFWNAGNEGIGAK